MFSIRLLCVVFSRKECSEMKYFVNVFFIFESNIIDEVELYFCLFSVYVYFVFFLVFRFLLVVFEVF